ncbi:MAG TPA: VOC family protein [Polyangiaceae bacterium]|nr:VOC family protein [Polyangiaceae bacterium]
MKPPPAGWPRLSASVFYDDPKAAIDWLCRAFGFELRMKVEGDDGSIVHSELCFGEGLVMVSGSKGEQPWQRSFRSPRSLGGSVTQALALHVDDVDAHHARAVQAGAEIIREPRTDDYGDDYWSDRTYGAIDPEGHLWWFMQRVKGPRERAE